jgi:DNA-binding SARP family transcriptional activator
LIRAHLARGDRASAARAYARCADRLAADLGVEPTSETRSLLDGVRMDRVRRPSGSRPRADRTATAGGRGAISGRRGGRPRGRRAGHGRTC